MTYQQAIDHLYTQLPVFSRIGAAAYKKDIHNTIALCEALGNPQKKFRSIHIAGTNGKGSTSHMLAAMLQSAGYRTGLYTSPHIRDFGERIRINGEMVDQSFVVDFTLRTMDLCLDIQPSFFELTVAMAFEYFAEKQVDIAVIETGLGGRLDSTNILEPLLSVITNIGMDHMNLLGNDLQSIASEKAGIIKKNTPVVIGETIPETAPVFQKKAAEVSAPVFLAEEMFQIDNTVFSGNKISCLIKDLQSGNTIDINLDLAGQYQLNNLRTAWTARKILLDCGLELSDTTSQTALSHVRHLTGLGGRWEIVSNDPLTIHDVGHNKDGIKSVCRQLTDQYPDYNWHFVIGFVNDKDICGVLEQFPANARYYFTNAHMPRAMRHDELCTMAASFGLKGNSFDDVNDALRAAASAAGEKDVIMVCGSFFILSEIRQ